MLVVVVVVVVVVLLPLIPLIPSFVLVAPVHERSCIRRSRRGRGAPQCLHGRSMNADFFEQAFSWIGREAGKNILPQRRQGSALRCIAWRGKVRVQALELELLD